LGESTQTKQGRVGSARGGGQAAGGKGGGRGGKGGWGVGSGWSGVAFKCIFRGPPAGVHRRIQNKWILAPTKRNRKYKTEKEKNARQNGKVV